MKLDRFAVLIRMNELGMRYQNDLAHKAGITRITLTKGMNGGSVSGDTVEKLAAALKTDAQKIIIPYGYTF